MTDYLSPTNSDPVDDKPTVGEAVQVLGEAALDLTLQPLDYASRPARWAAETVMDGFQALGQCLYNLEQRIEGGEDPAQALAETRQSFNALEVTVQVTVEADASQTTVDQTIPAGGPREVNPDFADLTQVDLCSSKDWPMPKL